MLAHVLYQYIPVSCLQLVDVCLIELIWSILEEDVGIFLHALVYL